MERQAIAARPLRPCRHPRCPELTEFGYCQAHQPLVQRVPDTRESASVRGYDGKWRKFRLRYLSQHPLCSDCFAEGSVNVASEVHHVVKLKDAPERRLDEVNLMPLCKTHHQARTARGE